jgi:hypothetical protein
MAISGDNEFFKTAPRATFRRNDVSYVVDSAGHEVGVKWQIDRFQTGAFTVSYQPTRDGQDDGEPVHEFAAHDDCVAIEIADRWVADYCKERGGGQKYFPFGINDQYGRDCGCWYEIVNYGGDRAGIRVHFQALRGGRKYQALKFAPVNWRDPGFENFDAAFAHAQKMVESYRKRCAKQFS